jgi:hypothetical protein
MDRALVHLWSPHQHSWHINVKEFWSVYRCLHSWSPEFSGATIMIGCDNLTIVAWLNNGCTRSPLAMKFLRKIFWLCAKFDFHLMASWIPTETNTLVDAISCLDFACFHLCSGIPLSGVSGIALSPPRPPPSLLSPYANSSEFRNLLKWLRMSSLPKQETSYWLLMHDPCNVLERLHGRFLFGFALLMPTTPDPLLNESLSASPPFYTSRVTPPPPSSLTWPAATWLSGQPSWLGSFPFSGHPTSFQEVLGTLTEFYSSNAPMSSSRMREQSLKSDVRKQISLEIKKSVSPFLKFWETNFALCWPSGPSSKLSRLSHLSPPSLMPLSVMSTMSSY